MDQKDKMNISVILTVITMFVIGFSAPIHITLLAIIAVVTFGYYSLLFGLERSKFRENWKDLFSEENDLKRRK